MSDVCTHTCRACGATFTPRPSQVWGGRQPKYCSTRCATAHGPWSYPASHPTTQRVYGTTKP